MSKVEYDVAILKYVMVPMRDGIRLATDIYRPTRVAEAVKDRFPVLLERTPYNKERKSSVDKAFYFVRRGYVFRARGELPINIK